MDVKQVVCPECDCYTWQGYGTAWLISGNIPLMHADWIEHVIATGGDQYLKTPEHLLPWHVRVMLDVYLALAAFFGGLLWLTLLGLRRVFSGRAQRAAPGAKASAPVKAEGVKTFHVVASTQPGMTGQCNTPPACKAAASRHC